MDTELNILIVDDDEVDRMAVRRHLEPSALPLVIHESDSAKSALSLIQENRIDCLLLDHILPGIDGLELMRRIRKDPAASPPIIMLTGHGDELLAAELMKAGAADYIPKAELSSERLSAAILGSIRLAEQQRQIARTQLGAAAKRSAEPGGAELAAGADCRPGPAGHGHRGQRELGGALPRRTVSCALLSPGRRQLLFLLPAGFRPE